MTADVLFPELDEVTLQLLLQSSERTFGNITQVCKSSIACIFSPLPVKMLYIMVTITDPKVSQ